MKNLLGGFLVIVVGTLSLATLPLSAQEADKDSVVARLEAFTQCYAQAMAVLPLWELELEFGVLEDSTDDWKAHTEADSPYYEATIAYDPDDLRSASDSILRRYAVHELFHVLEWRLGELAEMYNEEWALDEQERLATIIERWPVWQMICRE